MPTSDIRDKLRCPACGGALAPTDTGYRCVAPSCAAVYPSAVGVPALFHPSRSLFSTGASGTDRAAFFGRRRGGLAAVADRLLPSLSANVRARRNYARLGGMLTARGGWPAVLILGAGEGGEGSRALKARVPHARFVETDVFAGPGIEFLCDAHDIPFEDGSFDAVVAQAVLEHVADPQRCVEEIHRVLKPEGLVYAETAFLQPVHGAPYDFTRFTLVGYRRLFRRFANVACGVACGPGMALALAYEHFLSSFAPSRACRRILSAWARLTAFPLKYFDYYLADKPYAREAAAAYYFLGTKADTPLGDREIITEMSK